MTDGTDTLLKVLKRLFTTIPESTTPPALESKTVANTHKKPPAKARSKKNNQPKKTHNTQKLTPSIHQSWQVEDFTVEEQEGKTRFHDLFLPNALMQAIQKAGFQYCTPIQAEVLGSTLKGRDTIGQAQTGTGKTAAFLVSIISQLIENSPPDERYMGEPRALIIAPTRELVIQISKEAEQLTQYCSLNVISLVGGMDFHKQLKQLESQYCDILVATPGRLLDFIQRNEVYLDMLEVLVLDEADRMLDMGFIPQVRQIIRQTPPKQERQTLFFSATFNDDVMDLAKQWTIDPMIVAIKPETVANESVEQHAYAVSESNKCLLLYNLIQQKQWHRVIVFANRRDQVRNIALYLKNHRISVGLLSGEVSQTKRISILEKFRAGKIQVLVATDVAARGIHIDDISHVINFNLPETPDDYVHRIGRTGRAGSTGIAFSFIGEDDAFTLPAIEQLLGYTLNCEMAPTELLTPPTIRSK